MTIERDALEPIPVDVVSIQSQVVYGSVGNSVAVPTMRALGLNVVAVPTVLLSNVPHYDSVHGGPVATDWFAGFLADLERRRALTHVRAIVLGYLGPPEQTTVLADWLERVLHEHPEIRLVLDPVMGDHDAGVYVHPSLPPLLRDRFVPMAHGMTPNAFELEQIVGRQLATLDDTVAAVRDLLATNLEWAVVTSAAPAETEPGETRMVVVTRDDVNVISHRLVESPAKGTGDLFTAALVGGLLRGYSLKAAAKAAAERTVAVLEHSAAVGCGELVLV